MYKIKRTASDEKGTFYQLFYGDLFIHYEYCRSALVKVMDCLQSGEILYDILSEEFKDKEQNVINNTTEKLNKAASLCDFLEVNIKQLKQQLESLQVKYDDLKAQKEPFIPNIKPSVITTKNRSYGFRRDDFNLQEVRELLKYCLIFKVNKLNAHWNVNDLITDKDCWDEFPIMRSMNTHSNGYTTPGIREKYFAVVCDVLNIDGDGGSKLEKAEHY
ncbi:hypothetical protein [Psychromonas sp. MME2]|uniref:hypothetical protein n=1 Tax=unclassified Psychromonas TaxID=2614957 RepID=UPI00339BDB21